MAKISQVAFERARVSGSLRDYTRVMTREIRRYKRLEKPFLTRVIIRAKKAFRTGLSVIWSRVQGSGKKSKD